MSYRSFKVLDSSSESNGIRAQLEGHDLYNTFALGVAYGVFDVSDTRYYVDNYDGYGLKIIGFGSVVSWQPGAVEAGCLYSATVGGGHCGGIKHIDEEDKGEPWGMWFTTAEYDLIRAGRDTQLGGYDISSQWYNTRYSDEDGIDAALNGEWHVEKFLPKMAAEYDQDYRWSPNDGLTDVVGFFYTHTLDANGNVDRYDVHFAD